MLRRITLALALAASALTTHAASVDDWLRTTGTQQAHARLQALAQDHAGWRVLSLLWPQPELIHPAHGTPEWPSLDVCDAVGAWLLYLAQQIEATPAPAGRDNDRVEGRDAALSRRVPSHDGLCGNGSEVGAGDAARKESSE